MASKNSGFLRSGITLVRQYGKDQFPIQLIAWSQDASMLAAVERSSNRVHIWPTAQVFTKQAVKSTAFGGRILDLTFVGNDLIVAGSQARIEGWMSTTGAKAISRRAYWPTNDTSGGLCMAGSNLLAVGAGSRMELWRIEDGLVVEATDISVRMTVRCLIATPDQQTIIIGGGSEDDSIVRRWNTRTQRLENVAVFDRIGAVNSIACCPGRNEIVCACQDGTLRIVNLQSGQVINVVEGHLGSVTSVSLSVSGSIAASTSKDGTLRLWRTDTWSEVAKIGKEYPRNASPANVAFSPNSDDVLATSGANGKGVSIWKLDVEALKASATSPSTVYYTSARIALVGDSGVGKTGLGYRIADGRFRVTESTHGQQFWVVQQLGMQRADGTNCEAVLWDFAGQPNFKPVHALFLEDVDLALVLFDAARQDTYRAVEYWLNQLSRNRNAPKTVLVAARTDVSKLRVPLAEIEGFCREHQIVGGFVATSAKLGDGIDVLLDIIRKQIDWSTKPATITTETFKKIKELVLNLKSNANAQRIILSPSELRTQIEQSHRELRFTDAELMTAARHLQNHGYVNLIRHSSDEESILMAPDILINLASSFVLNAQTNEKGLGALDEAGALRNEYKFPELNGLARSEQKTLLNAVTELFLKRNICFRESIDNQAFLIFPSLINERPPRLVEGADLVESATYLVTGAIENVYAAIVVLLGYSPTFQRSSQWHKQAQYETARGEICGFKLANDNPNELELVVYYGTGINEFTKSRFQGLFEEILYSRNVNVEKYLPVTCPTCKRQLERRTVIRRHLEGKDFVHCDEDATKISLTGISQRILLNEAHTLEVARDQTFGRIRTSYETALVRVKGLVRDRDDQRVPSCFISYARGVRAHEQWVQSLADDLRSADVRVLLDQDDNAEIGASIPRFMELIREVEFVLLVGTPEYRKKYTNQDPNRPSMVAAEGDLINKRLVGSETEKKSVLPILLDGSELSSFPPLVHARNYADFRAEHNYFAALFELLLTMYKIPASDPAVKDQQSRLRGEALDMESAKQTPRTTTYYH